MVPCTLFPSALVGGKPFLCLRLGWGLAEHWLPPTAAATGSILQRSLGFPPTPKGSSGTTREEHLADTEEHTSAWARGHDCWIKS